MSGLSITLTNAGLVALTAAKGSNAITIASIGLTAASFTPAATTTSLPNEIKKLTTISGEVADDTTVHLSIRDETTDSYELRGFGLYLSDGTLFGLYGNGNTLIMEKATGSVLLLAVDLKFSESTATAITFGDTNFINPPATTETKGVAELATDAEATTGTDTARVVTPASMKAAVSSWLNTRFGSGAPSAFVKGLLTSASAAVMRSALGLKSAALQEASYFTDIIARLGFTPVRQGTGIGQSSNQVSIGWNGSSRLKATVDNTDIGNFVFDGTLSGGKLTINGSTMQRKGNNLWGPDNDGAGSGLDAGLLCGHDSSYYTNISARLGYTPLNKGGDTVTGDITFSGVPWMKQKSSVADQYYGLINGPDAQHALLLRGYISDYNATKVATDISSFIEYGGEWRFTQLHEGSLFRNVAVISTGGIKWMGNTVWHSGNDGSGSGSDADTVDGKHASAFALAGGSNASGEWPINVNGFATSVQYGVSGTNSHNLLYGQMADNDYFRLKIGATASNSGFVEIATADDGNEPIYIRQYNGTFATVKRTLTLLDKSGNTSVPGNLSANGIIYANQNGTGKAIAVGDDCWLGDVNVGSTMSIRGRSDFNAGYVKFGSNGAQLGCGSGSSTLTYGGNTVWHAGNDGSGSGLDADTVDGKHASAFAAASHTHSISQISGLQSQLNGKLSTGTVHVTSCKNAASGGYRVWSDGFKECWGNATVPANGSSTVTYPISFSSWSRAMASGGKTSHSQQDNGPFASGMSTTNCTIYNAIDSAQTAYWRAWGY